jgi:Antirestriction protein (ArdA)
MLNNSIALNPKLAALSSATSNESSNSIPKIYVSTYDKYNNGSLAGAWFDLSDYADYEELLEAVLKVHKDEEDPELMIQAFEHFPKDFYQETWSQENIEKLVAYADFYNCSTSNEIDAFECFVNNDLSLSLLDFEELKDRFEECYKATPKPSFSSTTDTQILADYLEEIDGDYIESKFKEAGIDHLYRHFSWESYAHDCECDGNYYVINGHIFSNL